MILNQHGALGSFDLKNKYMAHKKITLWTTGLIALILHSTSHAQIIQNIKTHHDNRMVVVEYDLIDSDVNPVSLFIWVRINDSINICPKLVTGDLKSVKSGKNKRISWMALEELGAIDASIEVSLHVVPTVKIGKKVWMATNLNVDKFQNGDLIPEARNAEEWAKAATEGKPAWCYIGDNQNRRVEHGIIYNWYAVNDPRGLAPRGFHIPTDEEWRDLNLNDKVSSQSVLKSTYGWYLDGNGSNHSGFSGIPIGYRNSDGVFVDSGFTAAWWSSSSDSQFAALVWSLTAEKRLNMERTSRGKGNGFSVRCLMD